MPDVRKGSLIWLVLSALVIVLDQLTKWVAVSELQLYQQVPIIDDLFSFTLAYNTGAAFSFLADASGWQRWLFAVIAVVVSIVLCVWLARLDRSKKLEAIALALILGGAIGNLYDRVIHGTARAPDRPAGACRGSFPPCARSADRDSPNPARRAHRSPTGSWNGRSCP